MEGGGSVDVTVTIATRNRASALRQTLRSLEAQRLNGLTWQIIVADNGSEDDTPDVLRVAAQALPIESIRVPEPGKNRALNRAGRLARGDLLVFTDDDVIADPEWVSHLVAAAERWPDVNIFGGAIDPVFPPGTPPWLTEAGFPHGRWAFSSYRPRQDEGPTRDTPLGPNLAIRAHRFQGVSWDESIGPRGGSFAMGSEVELLMRLQREGEVFVFVPDARVRHVLPEAHVRHSNLQGRAFRCGRGNARLFSRSASRYPLVGVPTHLWTALAWAAGRRLRTLPRSRARRRLADLELRQAWGHVWEVSRMRRQGELHGEPRLFPSVPALGRACRKVGDRIRTGLATALVPYRSVQVFVQDLPADEAHRPDPDGVRVYRGMEHLVHVLRALSVFPHLRAGRVEDRLQSGDSVAIARLGDRTVGYAWAATRTMAIAEVGGSLTPLDNEVIGYDIYVDPSARGRGIALALDLAQMRLAARRGLRTQLTWVESSNRRSIAAVSRMGKRLVAKIHVIRTPLLGTLRCWSTDDAVKRRLTGAAGSHRRSISAAR